MMRHGPEKAVLYAGLVWAISGLALTVYGVMGLLDLGVPGVEELVRFATTTEGSLIFLAAFTVMYIEGLYVIGSFFPGATLVLIIAVLAQTGGVPVFLLTILSIFLGWCAAGITNVLLARAYHRRVINTPPDPKLTIQSRPWTTWFPTFRANYEVAQVTEGAAPTKVFLLSLPIRIIASIIAALATLLIPLIIDINEVSNEEGFISVAVLAVVSYIVGGIKLRQYYSVANKAPISNS